MEGLIQRTLPQVDQFLKMAVVRSMQDQDLRLAVLFHINVYRMITIYTTRNASRGLVLSLIPTLQLRYWFTIKFCVRALRSSPTFDDVNR